MLYTSFFIACNWAHYDSVFVPGKSFKPSQSNTLAYWAHLQVTKKRRCEYDYWAIFIRLNFLFNFK